MADVYFKSYSEAAAYAKRRAQELGVPTKFARSADKWVVQLSEPQQHPNSSQQSSPPQSPMHSSAESRKPESGCIDFYNISTEELRAVIASNFSQLSNNQVIIIYNQMDRLSLSLSSNERLLLQAKYDSIKPTFWSGSNAFGVYASTDGQD